MSHVLNLFIAGLVLAGALQRGDTALTVGAAVLLGLILGRILTFAYRRGEIVNLERKLAAQREWDEEDTP